MTTPALSEIITTLGGATAIGAGVRWVYQQWLARTDTTAKREADEHREVIDALKQTAAALATSSGAQTDTATSLRDAAREIAAIRADMRAIDERETGVHGALTERLARVERLLEGTLTSRPPSGEWPRATPPSPAQVTP